MSKLQHKKTTTNIFILDLEWVLIYLSIASTGIHIEYIYLYHYYSIHIFIYSNTLLYTKFKIPNIFSILLTYSFTLYTYHTS